MHPFPLFFVLLYFLLLTAAAPTSTTSTASSSSTTHRPTSASSATNASSASHKTSPTHIPHVVSVSPAQQSAVIPRPGSTPTHSRTFNPDAPAHTRNPFQNPHVKPSRSGQKPISIVFEVLGGVAASALLLGFIRCFHNYRKTPARDRIADILHRHQLQRELEELGRNPHILRRHHSIRDPAPPYFPRPPSYENVLPSMPPVSIASSRDHHLQDDDRAHYIPVATNSPPSSPPMSERILLPTPAVTPGAHPRQPS
ncbi:hypothetical protein BDN70DRAFT_933631 [Pholiota conissans]|uniref:Transmembrane protein n=1 Tax=Pholiota conissans TaxID=109636 RepID=A0A9P6CT91_9AGAR|nr:hypothetical protein BDN70DRAFT_933631 [Pholiota conissans]